MSTNSNKPKHITQTIINPLQTVVWTTSLFPRTFWTYQPEQTLFLVPHEVEISSFFLKLSSSTQQFSFTVFDWHGWNLCWPHSLVCVLQLIFVCLCRSMSAVCVYSMEDIDLIFQTSRFKGDERNRSRKVCVSHCEKCNNVSHDWFLVAKQRTKLIVSVHWKNVGSNFTNLQILLFAYFLVASTLVHWWTK